MNVRLFRNHADYLQALGGLLSRKTFPEGVTLMTAEQVGEAVYFIMGGTVKFHVEQEDGSDVIMAILGPGEIVGEMSVLGQTIRSASVVTIESCVMLWMDCAAFQSCLLEILSNWPTTDLHLWQRGCATATRRSKPSPHGRSRALSRHIGLLRRAIRPAAAGRRRYLASA